MDQKIKEFRKREEIQEDQRSTINKIKRHKRVKLYKAMAIVCLIIVVCAVMYWNWKNQVYSDYEIKQTNKWNKVEGTTIMPLYGNLLVYSSDGMSLIDTKGSQIWNQTYEIQSPIVRTCKDVVAIADYNGKKIYVANASKILGTVETTMPIRDLSVAANGVVAAVLDDESVTSIYLYSVSGEQLVGFKTTMSKSGYPVTLAMTEDGSQVAVSYLKAQKGQITSSIGFYNFSSVGQNYTDNLVGAHGYSDSVIPFITFMGNNTSVAVADNRLMFFQGKQVPHNINDVFLSEQIQGIYYSKDYLGLVFYNSEGDTEYKIDIYNTKGEKTQTIFFDMQYKDILFGKEGMVIYNEKQCCVYDWKGNKRYEGVFQERVNCMINSDYINKYVIVTESDLQIIELR